VLSDYFTDSSRHSLQTEWLYYLGERINISYILIALNNTVKISIRGEATMYGGKGQSQINTQGRGSGTERDDAGEHL
jgi:hypothetical protein